MKLNQIGKIVKNHLVVMIICCALPLIAITVLSVIGVLGSWGLYALLVLCPLLHILMIRGILSTPYDLEEKERHRMVKTYTKEKTNFNM